MAVGLDEEDDVQVHEAKWLLLRDLFGVDDALFVPRLFIEEKQSTSFILSFSLTNHWQLAKSYREHFQIPKMCIYLPENIGYIESELCRMLHVAKNKKTRLWIHTNATGSEFQMYRDRGQYIYYKTLPDEEVSKLKQVCKTENVSEISDPYNCALEIADANGMWPTLLTGEPTPYVHASQVDASDTKQQTWEKNLQYSFHMAQENLSSKLTRVTEDILRDTEKTNTKLFEEIKALRTSLEEQVSKVDDLQKSLSNKSDQLVQLGENLKVEKEAMKVQRDHLEMDREKFDNDVKTVEDINKLRKGMVTLNVGGHRYDTSILTLTKDPDSMLAAMFGGRHPLDHNEDGTYFIDRDGTYFRYILNYLRGGSEGFEIPDKPWVRKELRFEAKFYMLNGLVELLSKHIDE